MAFTPAKECPRFLQSLQKTFDLAVNSRNYKQGAFRGQIDETTNPFTALRILVASPLLTAPDREKFRNVLDALTLLENCDLHRIDPSLFLSLASWSLEIADVFSADARAQGMYVPPMMIQAIDTSTGGVTSTSALDDDGTITEARGGRPLEVPGAPTAFNDAQARKAMDLGLAHSANNAVPKGGFDKDGVRATDKNMDKHQTGGMLRGEELVEEQDAEADAEQEKLKGAKQAKRNAMERERKKRKRRQAKHAAQNVYEEGSSTIEEGDSNTEHVGGEADNEVDSDLA